jgi:putative hydrolase of the HAD superfamily
MNQYLELRMGMPADQVSDIRSNYFQRYGTTLRGLQKHHQVDEADYLAYVHDVPLDDYLQASPDLRDILFGLPQECWIFTNADRDHAQRVLRVMGLTDCFQGIIDIISTKYACKPQVESFCQALSIAGQPAEKNCVMIDDSLRNLITARELGMTTVLISENNEFNSEVDLIIPDLFSIPEIFR